MCEWSVQISASSVIGLTKPWLLVELESIRDGKNNMRSTPLEVLLLSRSPDENPAPSSSEQSRLFDLLGKIDHRVLAGENLYIQIKGTPYKVLYGLYWRSVRSGTEFWGLRCEEIADGMWMEGAAALERVDLPVCYTSNGWAIADQLLGVLTE